MAPIPIIPQPITITYSLSITCARDTAWNPTLIGSINAQLRGEILPAGIIFVQGNTAYSHITPLRCTPNVSLCSQALTRPLRQEAHLPQLVYGFNVTFIPFSKPAGTFGPTSSITAPTSCPGITGNFTIGLRPKKVFRSEPQKPTYLILTNTSPTPTVGFSSSTTFISEGLTI